MNPSTRLSLVLISFAGLAASAWAQNAQPEPTLEGPRVKDNGIPNQTRKFAAGVNGDRKAAAAERGTPQRLFMRALDSLRGDKAAEGVRLSAEQEAKIKAINEEFTASQREYFQSHKAEIETVLAGLPENERRRISQQFQGLGPELKGRVIERIAGDKPAKGKGAPGEKQAEKPADKPAEEMMPAEADAKAKEAQAAQGREKLKALYEAMPQPKDVQTKIWGILSDAQKPVVQAELDKAKKEMEARAKANEKGSDPARPLAGKDKLTDEDLAKLNIPDAAKQRIKNLSPEQRVEAVRKFLDRNKPGASTPAAPAAANKDKITDDELAKMDLPERVKERLKGISPEERPAAIEKLKERLKNEGQGRRPGAGGGGQDKPAPSSKDVNVPAPK